MKRVSRACVHCRARKNRCDLEASNGTPPCGRCVKEGRECVLATSKRGGHRPRKKNIRSSERSSSFGAGISKGFQENYGVDVLTSPNTFSSYGSVSQGAAVQDDATEQESDSDASLAADKRNYAPPVPRNPSDAFQLLTDVANREADQPRSSGGTPQQGSLRRPRSGHSGRAHSSVKKASGGITSYQLVSEGSLNRNNIDMLVARYAQHYHPYLPLVPRHYLQPQELDNFAAGGRHLLTAVLTIASRDLIDQPYLHLCCSRYMDELVLRIAAGHDCEVEAVEALLLLAEWEPQGHRGSNKTVGRGEEDRSAWMHVGIALRTAYFIGLDRTSFRQESTDEAHGNDSRKRLAWTSCYVSDRLVSVRLGRAFWSRGPGPMTGLSSRDFPSLQPLQECEDDYSQIFQAVLDLTQLYSNVQDVLYTGMLSSRQIMLVGDYVKYVDEFRMAIAHWNRIWGGLQCSQHLKATLQLSYEYLCLYTNAFVFQAAISQALASRPTGDTRSLRDHLRHAFSNVSSMPDARFIWASVAAAKNYLTIVSTALDPVLHLRHVPLRYYLYTVYSAVFLFKARLYGVVDHHEEQQIRQLVQQTMDVLRKASVSPQDPGSRYAKLLELLWMNVPKGTAPVNAPSYIAYDRSDLPLPMNGSFSQDAGGHVQYSPAAEFSWLDLEAASLLVLDEQTTGSSAMGSMAGMQSPLFYAPVQTNFQWNQTANMVNSTYFDMDGSLLF